jgi:hypothetical protein
MPDYNSKVVLANGTVLMDLTSDTVDAAHLLSGYTAHGANGAPITGSCAFDADTSGDTLTVSEALTGKTFHARGTAYTGTMANNGAVSGTISTKAGAYTVPQGYHDGSGTVTIASTEQAKIIAGNIKSGVQILGVTGTYTGAAISAQSKNATPTFSAQTIQPDSGYDYLSSVTVAAISVTYADNAAGGKTVTIGAV